MSEIGNHLWQSALFALAASLAALLLRKNNARIRYWIWLVASLKFLVPFSLLVLAGSRMEAPAPVPPVLLEQVSASLAPVLEPLAPPANSEPFPMSRWLFAIWLIGAAVVAWRWIRGWGTVRAAARAATPMALRFPATVLSTPHPIEPGIFGIWKPVLLLPEGLAPKLTPEEFAAILAHEQCHLRHRDNLTAAMHMVVEVLFWFHPLVWWIGARLIEERERACDEAVVAGGQTPAAYAQGILTVCRYCIESPVACAAGVSGSDLKKRIEVIMKNTISRQLSFSAKAALTLAALAALLTPFLTGMLSAPAARAQAQAADAFEVASVKPGDPAEDRVMMQLTPGGGVRLVNVTLKSMITFAYNVQPAQVTGGPGWIDSDRFEVVAKGPESAGPAPSPLEDRDRTQRRLQALLRERFGLVLKKETKEMPGFALMVAKGGAKMTESASADRRQMRLGGRGEFSAQGISMEQLAAQLGRTLGRKVVDQTRLAKTYDFTLRWSPQPGEGGPGGPRPADSDSSGPTIFTALQEQLGLRLESQKVQTEMYVVERAEKPSEN
jgi:uncharacterized protein (TIGR03435 family)